MLCSQDKKFPAAWTYLKQKSGIYMKKRMISCLLAVLIVFLSGCGRKSASVQELKKLGLDPRSGNITLRILSKKAFHGDDLLKLVIKFPQDLSESLQKDLSWHPFPMDEDTFQWVDNELDGIASPATQIRSGYYTLQGVDPAEPDISLHKGHYNFIVAVYDQDRQTLYYCEVSA